MQEFEPKLKKKTTLTKETIGKYVYVLVLAVLLVGGISYGYTFFIQNRKIASGSITTADLTINFSNRSISASNLAAPQNDAEGLTQYSKSITITNQTAIDGRVKLTLTRTSGLNLTDMRYALIVNGAIQEIDDVPTSGEIFSSAIMGGSPTGEVINVEVRLWPKTSYSGNETTFVGELTPEIKYLGQTAASIDSPAGKYVNFNCSSTCEVWQIVKIEDGRLVLTRQANYSGATSRTNSNKYNPESFNPALTFNDDSMITSLSTDGLNVYLAKTVKITGGSGTLADPYELENNIFNEEDKKVIAVITYKDDNNTTVGTQRVYYNETNYISQVINDPDFIGWTDGTNDYELGDTITFTTDKQLTAVINSNVLLHDSVLAMMDSKENTLGHSTHVTDNTNTIYMSGTSSDVDYNYVWYSGKLWRITSVLADGTVKMVTDDAITTILYDDLNGNSAFYTNSNSKSDVYQWLNEDFYSTLYNASNIIDTTKTWNATTVNNLSSISTIIPETTMVSANVGLLNTYEYYKAYENTTAADTYLALKYDGYNEYIRQYLITPKSSTEVYYVQDTVASQDNLRNSYSAAGVRPCIYVSNSVEITAGDGTINNPYRLSGDISAPENNVTLINTRTSGEYVKFVNSSADLYRIVGIEDNTTKVVRESSVGGYSYYSSPTGNTNDIWVNYGNNTYYNNLVSSYGNIFAQGKYYEEPYLPDDDMMNSFQYKYFVCASSTNINTETTANCTRAPYNSRYVGALRIGEMFATQIKKEYHSFTSYLAPSSVIDSENYYLLLIVGDNSLEDDMGGYGGIRPTVHLKSTVTIRSGSGTRNDPFIVS